MIYEVKIWIQEKFILFQTLVQRHSILSVCGFTLYQVRGGRHLGQLGDVELHVVLGQGH